MPKSFEYTPLFAWRAEARWAAGSGLRRAAPLLVFYGGMYEATPACPRPDAKSPCFVDRRESAAATGEQRGTRALRRLRKVGEHAAKCVGNTSRAAEHGSGAGAGLADLVTRQRGHDSRIEGAAGGPLPSLPRSELLET